MHTEMLHGDVIVGMSVYDELDHELCAACDAELSGHPMPRQRRPADDDGGPWGAGGSREFAGRPLQRDVAGRGDAEVCREVLRALRLDSFVPLTVDAQVSDGVVMLTGTVCSERERKDVTYLAGCVPGIVGVLDGLTCRPLSSGDDEATREAVACALACTAIADVAELTVDAAGWGSVVLSGAVQSRSDHDLAIATAWSVSGVQAVEDCIQVEG
jgi:osmotically-inducible protein OsmY